MRDEGRRGGFYIRPLLSQHARAAQAEREEQGILVASAYGKGHIDNILGENNSNILYTKNNEDVHQLLSKGVQFPQAMADDILAKNSVPQFNAAVKSGQDVQLPQAVRSSSEIGNGLEKLRRAKAAEPGQRGWRQGSASGKRRTEHP
jgi:hypothetical protein